MTSPNPALVRDVEERRTFAIISHPDAGKTTLTEKLLLFGGAIQMAGAVKGRKASRHATSDWMEVEKQRGISVTSSVMQFHYRDHVINLLDTPGHEDFSEDTYRVLTAVDAAVMVIDAAKGVEAQTIKLLEVCRMRKTPIITFINKFDREVRDPLDLLGEIENVLKLQCVPITWPIGMGKTFRGVFSLLKNHLVRFTAGEDRLTEDRELIEGLDNPELDELYPMEMPYVRESIELVQGATDPFDLRKFLAGDQSPVFFGSGVNNFGVEDVLNALVDWAPRPQPRDAGVRMVDPFEDHFSGFVFKIQANMDPRHRDRIAFFRVCSGRYQPGMKVLHGSRRPRNEDSKCTYFHGAGPCDHDGCCCWRHHRYLQPWPASYWRYLDTRRKTAIHRHPQFCARTVPCCSFQRSIQGQAIAEGTPRTRGRRCNSGFHGRIRKHSSWCGRSAAI